MAGDQHTHTKTHQCRADPPIPEAHKKTPPAQEYAEGVLYLTGHASFALLASEIPLPISQVGHMPLKHGS
jgi:hypothetical protein